MSSQNIYLKKVDGVKQSTKMSTKMVAEPNFFGF